MIQISLKNLKSNDKKEKLWNYVVYMILDAQINGLKEIYLFIDKKYIDEFCQRLFITGFFIYKTDDVVNRQRKVRIFGW